MSYSSGGLIQATDFNALATTNPSIGGQWGVGTAYHGLGQNTSAISTVAAGSAVSASQWTGLIQTINSCLQHEGQAAITPSSVTAGNTITFYNSIATGSAAAYNNTGVTGLATSDSSAYTASYSGAWGTSGSRILQTYHSVTWASADAARYFFNAGGKIKLTFARSGGSATTRNADWSSLAAAFGTIVYGFNNTTKVGGSGSMSALLNANNGGYWNCNSSTWLLHAQQYDSSAGYTTDSISFYSIWGAAGANGGSITAMFATNWQNSHVQAWQDAVDGTTSSSLVVSSPSTTYLSNSWGTPTVATSTTLY